MVTFSPPELRRQLADALELWSNRIGGDLPEGIPLPEEWDEEGPEEAIGRDTCLELSLSHWEGSLEISCGEFLKLVGDFEESLFVRAVGCIRPRHSLWRVTPVNPMAYRLMTSEVVVVEDNAHQQLLDDLVSVREKEAELSKTVDWDMRPPSAEQVGLRERLQEARREVSRVEALVERPTQRRQLVELSNDGRKVTVCLASGFTLFALHVTEAELVEEYYPPVAGDEAFVEVACSHSLTEEEALSFVNGYIFELSATVGAEFVLSPRLEVDEDPYGEFCDESSDPPKRLRPLAVGKGISELLSIYNRAIGTSDDELRILCFTKVIEFVAQTAVRLQSTETIRGKLMSPRAISPDAQFISELELLMEQQRAFKKDREAIRLAVSQCCDATELARHSPPFLKEFAVPNLAADPKSQGPALARFADVLYSTRNAIAHAKANYTATGDECPSGQISQFTACAKVAAEQVIRWFEVVPEAHRVF